MRALIKSETEELFAEHLAWAEVNMETGVINTATRPLERMFGYKLPGVLEGEQIEILIPEVVRERHGKEHRPSFNENPEPRMMGRGLKLEGQRKDGSIFPVEVLLLPRAVSKARVVIALVFDMTGRAYSHDGVLSNEPQRIATGPI